jgi:hypothetical protein
MTTKREETRLFDGLNLPQPHDDLRRPDISILNPPVEGVSRILIDMSITAPITGTENPLQPQPNHHILRPPGHQAQLRYTQKLAKYEDDCNRLNYKFIPFILETTGHVHTVADAFLHQLAKHANELRKIPEHILYHYFLKRLSCALQRANGNMIRTKTLELNRQHPTYCDRSFTDGAVYGNRRM